MFIHRSNSVSQMSCSLIKGVHIFNIHLIRCYLSSGASIQGWKKSWFVKTRDEKQQKILFRERDVVVKLMRCWFLVCNMQAYPQPGTLPTSVFVSSSIWTITPPSQANVPQLSLQLVQPSKNPPFLHPPQILPSCTPSPGWIQNPGSAVHGCGRIHPPIFPGNSPDIHANPCYEICQISAAWLVFFFFPYTSLVIAPHRSTLFGHSPSSSGGWKIL